MRFRRFVSFIVPLSLAMPVAMGTDAFAQSSDALQRAPAGAPRPFDEATAVEAGRQARAQSGPVTAAAGTEPPTWAVARVYATQYDPNTPGSVEVAVPDKCAKFAALRQPSNLASSGCPPGYALGLDYRALVVRDSGQYAAFPVRDVGPWNLDDNYWNFGPGAPQPRRLFSGLPPGLPESQAAFSNGYNQSPNCKNLDGTLSGHAGGADQFGRCVLNPAGIDLSVAAAAQLGLGRLQSEWVSVAFLWAPIRSNMRSLNSGMLLDVAGNQQADGVPIIQYPATGAANQQWRFVPLSSNTYAIVSVSSGKVLDVGGASTADGAPIIQYTWYGGANQQWRVEPTGEGEFRVVSVNSGKVLDVSGVSKSAGARLIQYTWLGAANQRWNLPAVGTG